MVKIESIRVLGIDSDDLTHDLLTVKQGAAYYGCSIENIHKMIQASKLDCFIDQDNKPKMSKSEEAADTGGKYWVSNTNQRTQFIMSLLSEV